MFLSLVLWAATLAGPAGAHPSPSSEVLLEVRPGNVRADVTLPVDELKLAFASQLLDATGTHARLPDAQLCTYLVAHIRPVASDGRAWSVRVEAIRWELARRPQDVMARVILTPPVGAPVGTLDLEMDLVAHAVPNHITMVAMRSTAGAKAHLLDSLHFGQHHVVIKAAEPAWWRTFGNLFRLGMEHIAEGADHLLFLLTLLLPAALQRNDNRWGKFGGTRHLVRGLLTVVTAFTVGHSMTLLLGATGLVTAPVQPVEIAIATSILISAIHAWRPIFPGKEGWIACAFGLIHGMAFATVIRDLNLQGARLAASILAFNLGIEAVQALLVLAIAPLLVLMARRGWYRYMRQCTAFVAAAMAVVWMAERITDAVI